MLFYVSFWIQTGTDVPIYGGGTYSLNREAPNIQDLLDITDNLKEKYNCDAAGIVGFFRMSEEEKTND